MIRSQSIAAGLRIETSTSTEGLEALADAWRALEAVRPSRNLTASYIWARTWWEVFGRVENPQLGFDKRLLIVRLYRGDELWAIVPLVRLKRYKRGLPISYLEFLGQQWGATMLDVVGNALSPEEMASLLQWLHQNCRFDLLHLSYLPAGSPNFDLTGPEVWELSACPFIDLTTFVDFDAYRSAVYSKNLKQNFRTAQNRLAADGHELGVEVLPIMAEEFAAMTDLSAQKLRDGGGSIYLDPHKAHFMRDIAAAFGGRVLFVTLDGRRVAYRFNLAYQDATFCLDAAYHRDYPRYELGSYSVQESLRESFAAGRTWHCEGTGMDPYKLKFAKDAIRLYGMCRPGNTWLAPWLAQQFRKARRPQPGSEQD